MLDEIIYLNENEEVQMSFDPWSNDFKVLAEMLGGYHELTHIGRYLLEVIIFNNGVKINAYRENKFNFKPLKFYISSHRGRTTVHLGRLDGEGANLLHRLVKAFNL
jgi:hypothetical protein